MKNLLLFSILIIATSCGTLNQARLTDAGGKLLQAAVISDAQIEAYSKEFIEKSDQTNNIASGNDPYAVRLNKIVGAFDGKDGLNIKVYKVKEVNAFACADGSIRVYSGLMDIMTDAEILGVVGHEIGHIRNKDTKDAFKNALLNSAVKDGLASTSDKVAALTDSQLGAIGESFLSARYSQKQEFEADTFGYDFLKSNGLNPWAMAMSFEKLQKLEQQAGSSASKGMQQLFSTHPDITVRATRMAERATKEGFQRPTK